MEEGVDVNTDCHIIKTLTAHLQNDNAEKMENFETLNEILEVKNELVKLQDVNDVLRENDKVEKNPEENLGGWLHLPGRGIANLIGTKQRWFQYGKENCKLYCYRDPQDLVPLGEISIATASFYFDAGNQDKPGMFKIKADGKEVSLDAGNRHNMMFWLQALQSKRRQFNISRSSFSTESVGYLSNTRANNLCGLVTKELGQASVMNRPEPLGDTPVTSDIPEILVPDCDNRGSNNSLNNLPSTGSKPFNNIKAELQQMWSTLKLPAFAKKNSGPLSERLSRVLQQQDSSESIFYYEVNPLDDVELVSLANTSTTSNDSQKSDDIYESGLCSVNEALIPEIMESDERALNNVNLNKNCNNSDNQTAKCSSWAIKEKTNLVSDDILQQQPSSPLPPKRDKTQQSMLSAAGGQSENDKLQKLGTNRNQSQNNSSRQGKLLQSLRKIRFGRRQIFEPVSAHGGAAVASGMDTVHSSSGNATNNQTDARDLTQSTISSCKDIEDVEDEVKANREIILVLQHKVDVLTLELQARLQVGEVSDERKTEMLVEREKQLTELQKLLEKIKEEYNITVEKLRATEAELQSTQDQVVMFMEMLKAKDEIVMTLTNQIFDHDQMKQQVTSSCDQPDVVQSLSSTDSSASVKGEKVSIRELESYKDMCQGYELQHKFLTKEILELNDLRKDDIAREKEMMIEFAKMQAKYYQIKSKYYVLLKQQREQSPKREGEDDQAVVDQLLQDALEADKDDIEMHLTGSGQKYDRYGFSCRHFMDETLGIEDDLLGNKAIVFERHSEELSNKVKEADKDTSLRDKWQTYMVGRGGILQRSQELKNLIRHGVPHEYREEVWKGCINFYVGDVREKSPGYYQSILQKKAQSSGSDPAIKQIELDLLRTLPNNKHYETIECEGTIKLRNILLAFSEYNRVIGYCQGLNRLAAIALLFMSEEDAFWCLVAIVDYILPPDYFSTTLMAAQADQRVLKDLVQEKLPKIHQKLEAQNVDLSLFTFNWFLTIFVDNVPVETFLCIWDTFLYEGSKVLFRFAAAFLKLAEEEILKQQDGLQLNKCLRKLGESMTNVKQIAWYAFNWVNPFSMKFLATRRQQHLHDINLELEELDKLRSGTKIDRRGKQSYFNSDDELDSFTD